jgi:D-serine deaminase-like pyridoxal phosphate-dependent protein
MLLSSLGVPTLLLPKTATGYSNDEIDRRLRSGRGTDGLTKHDLPTPSLLLDLDVFAANVDKMARHSRASRVNLRPHAKTHKCPEIARRQIRAGALGVCAATIREAEAMAGAGIKGLFITCEMVGKDKISRLVRVTRKQPDTMSAVDHQLHAEHLSQAALAAKINLNVMIDIDAGMHRTGIAAGEPAVALAERIMKLPNLKLRGIHAYSGISSHIKGFETRRAHSEQAMAPALETFGRLKKLGMPVEVFSGGSTGTYNIDTQLEGVTELQVGSYVFMDVEYRAIGGRSGEVYDDFGQSLSVIATVISQSRRGLATVDAGFKAFATDRGFGPDLKGITGVRYHFGGDEHGVLELQKPSREIKLGDRIEFIVPHCDPNVNLYDRIYCLRGDKVEAVWPIARGFV